MLPEGVIILDTETKNVKLLNKAAINIFFKENVNDSIYENFVSSKSKVSDEKMSKFGSLISQINIK
jgi:tRNA U54 and U55 pseudouridine synthase Pus10